MDEMTTTEIGRLIDWLKSKGMTDSEIVECLEAISKGPKKASSDK